MNEYRLKESTDNAIKNSMLEKAVAKYPEYTSGVLKTLGKLDKKHFSAFCSQRQGRLKEQNNELVVIKDEIDQIDVEIEELKRQIKNKQKALEKLPGQVNIFELMPPEYIKLEQEINEQKEELAHQIEKNNQILKEIEEESFFKPTVTELAREQELDRIGNQMMEEMSILKHDILPKLEIISLEYLKLKTLPLKNGQGWFVRLENQLINYLNNNKKSHSIWLEIVRNIYLSKEKRAKMISLQAEARNIQAEFNPLPNLSSRQLELIEEKVKAMEQFAIKGKDPEYRKQGVEFYKRQINQIRSQYKLIKDQENEIDLKDEIFLEKAERLEKDYVLSQKKPIEIEQDLLLKELGNKVIVHKSKVEQYKSKQNKLSIEAKRKPNMGDMAKEVRTEMEKYTILMQAFDKSIDQDEDSIKDNFSHQDCFGKLEQTCRKFKFITPYTRHIAISGQDSLPLAEKIEPLERLMFEINSLMNKNYIYGISARKEALADRNFFKVNAEYARSLQAKYESINTIVNQTITNEFPWKNNPRKSPKEYHAEVSGHMAENLFTIMMAGASYIHGKKLRWELTEVLVDSKEKADVVVCSDKSAIKIQLTSTRSDVIYNDKLRDTNRHNVVLLSIPSFDELSDQYCDAEYTKQDFVDKYFVSPLKNMLNNEKISGLVRQNIKDFLSSVND